VRASRVGYDEQYDLLTAALIGVVIGVGTTLLVRRGPSGRRPLSPLMSGAARGAKWAGEGAARLGKRGASWARDAGEELWDRIPREEIRDQVRDYVSRAHEAIDDTVNSELRDLRRALKRQRKRLGI
jgi:gas vesicle protein